MRKHKILFAAAGILLAVMLVLSACAGKEPEGTAGETNRRERYTGAQSDTAVWLGGDKWDQVPDVRPGTIVYSEHLRSLLEQYPEDARVVVTVVFLPMVSEEDRALAKQGKTERYYDLLDRISPEFEAVHATVLQPYFSCELNFMFHVEIVKRDLLSLTCKSDEALYIAAIGQLK